MSSPKVLQRRTQFAPCVVYLSPVKSWSVYAAPEIVSSARIEMTASICMVAIVDFECGQKRLRLAHFDDDPGELVGAICQSLRIGKRATEISPIK